MRIAPGLFVTDDEVGMITNLYRLTMAGGIFDSEAQQLPNQFTSLPMQMLKPTGLIAV